MKYYYNLKWLFSNIFENVIYSYDGNAEISAAITHVFSVTLSFRNHFNMLIWCSRNISYCYQFWKQLFCWIFLWIFFLYSLFCFVLFCFVLFCFVLLCFALLCFALLFCFQEHLFEIMLSLLSLLINLMSLPNKSNKIIYKKKKHTIKSDRNKNLY